MNLETLLNALPQTYYAWDPQEGFTVFAPKVEALTGYSAEALLAGTPSLDSLLTPEDAARALSARRARAAGEQAQDLEEPLEYRITRACGRSLWIRERHARGPEGSIVGTLVDSGPERMANRRACLEERLQAVGGLAAGFAHEVNNPLAGILNYAELTRRLVEGRPRLCESVEGILVEGRRIQELTRGLLCHTQRGAGQACAVEAGQLMKSALTVIRRELREDFVVVALDLPAYLPALSARPQRIEGALHLLLANARWALNERFPGADPDKVLRLTARHTEEDADQSPEGLGWIELQITDRGCGLGELSEAEAREPFNTTRAHAEGLGLHLAHELVSAEAGQLRVENSPQGGTTCRLRFPLWIG